MRMQSRWLRPAVAVLVAFSVPSFSRAEDGDEPAVAEKTETIASDWKKNINNKMSISKSRERAEYWEKKGVEPKDLYWLGNIWDRAEVFDKATDAYERYLKENPEGKLREQASLRLLQVAESRRDWASVVARAQAFRTDFGSSRGATKTWVDQGRAHRLLGEREKAVEAYAAGAESNVLDCILELVDLHLAEGDAAAAKGTLDKYREADIRGKEKMFGYFETFIAAVGQPGPSLDDAKSVGAETPPSTFAGKPAVLFFWHMQQPNGDRRLQRVGAFRSAYADQVNVVAVATYNQWNPETAKRDEAMTETQEIDWYKKFLEAGGIRGAPPVLVVPKASVETLRLQLEGQKVLLDKEGKLRYTRMFDLIPFDWPAVEMAVKKVLGS